MVALAVVFAIACLGLGRWQWHRYQEKSQHNAEVTRRYDAPPEDLTALLRSTAALQWRPARAQGRYDPAATVLIRNRPRDLTGKSPTFGFEVVVPLRLAGGGTLLVNRGWVPNSQSADRAGRIPDAVPPPPRAPVSVVVTLRGSEPARPQDLPPGQAASIATAELGSELPGAAAVYGALRSESPSPAAAPLPPPPPVLDGGEGINASYAVQWVLLAALALGFPWWFRRRTVAELTGEPRPRRRRIWDDEDE